MVNLSQSHVFPRHCKQHLPIISRGDGPYLFDKSGKAYLDGSGGAAVSCLGHNDPHVTDAIKRQIESVAYAHSGFFTSEASEELAERLAKLAPGDLSRVYFVSGGSEAMEAALKLARQYFLEIGQPERRHILARRQSYHGNTLGALATGGNMWRREPFAPMLIETTHISPCYAYREQHDGEADSAYVDRLINEAAETIENLGPDTVMAIVAEPVVGATMGAVPSVGDYFQRLRKLCEKHGILLILDEVMCGMGRTGTLFACEQDNVAPDICVLAKGLGAGYQPIGAMISSQKIYDAIDNGSGYFQHGHTYQAHPTACAAALAVLERLVDDKIAEAVTDKGRSLRQALQKRFDQHPNVGDIRGRGLFLGIEFVADRGSKAPFDPSLKVNVALKKAAFENGLICYPMGGTINGQSGDHVLLAPPFISTTSHFEELVDKLEKSLLSVLPQ